jgi:hypothetical protein
MNPFQDDPSVNRKNPAPMGITRSLAQAFQKDEELSTAVIVSGNTLTGQEKVLAVKRATDRLLMYELEASLHKVCAVMPSLSDPPVTRWDEHHLIVIEMFMRFQAMVKEKEEREKQK